ncbi:hypothetical protein HBE96_08215 [Clostridium sp. P21]|uniref:Uncharacterized protein n=1 Tax=Clostridium muellerianum TaxID=2716538 RepID=A0A7Y0EFX5_9CLOT|nr:hypothetical protein [Clostridium muellerianum]NMM62678.1 hypothetical protein [Clostridium muellerianum]
MNRGRTITFKYKHFQYDEHIKKLLSTDLNPNDELELQKIYSNYESLDVRRGYEYIIKDLYILIVKRNISTTDIANIYGIGSRTVQIWLKELGLNRTQKQAQKIAVTKRDYNFIKKGINNSHSSGSLTQNDIIYKLDKLLKEELNGYEIVIGITHHGISDCKTDIPVIVFKDTQVSKFLIETHSQLHKEKINRHKCYKLIKLSNNKDALKNVITEISEEVKGI